MPSQRNDVDISVWTMAVKYGIMKTIVSGLTVVLASGEIIETGTRVKNLQLVII